MLGQIATFMDGLHLSYTEVFEVIPYRNLQIMQMDKLHVAYGEVRREVSEEDFFKGRRRLVVGSDGSSHSVSPE